jgi:drug/metabolite transporter (DMT)-like permease
MPTEITSSLVWPDRLALRSISVFDVEGCDLLRDPQMLALCASFLFGLALVLTQFGLRHLSPGRGAFVSIPTSAVLLSALAPLMLDSNGWDPRGALIFVLVGLLFPATVTLLTFEANRRMGPSISGALSNLTPVFAILAAALLFREMPRPLQALGVVMVVIGVVMLSIERDWHGRRWHYSAILLPVGIAAIRGLTHPITKLGLTLWHSPFAAVLIGYLASSLVVTVVVAASKSPSPTGNGRIGQLWFGCVGACNGFGVLAMYAALARGSVLLVSPLVATYPLVTVTFSAILLRSTRMTIALVTGVATTVAGVMLLVAM